MVSFGLSCSFLLAFIILPIFTYQKVILRVFNGTLPEEDRPDNYSEVDRNFILEFGALFDNLKTKTKL